MKITLGEIANLVGGVVEGDSALIITGANAIEEAESGDICFVRAKKHWPKLATTQASAVIAQKKPENCDLPLLLVGNPDLAFGRVLQLMEQTQRQHPEGLHPQAVIAPQAIIGANVAIDAFVRISDHAEIGDNTIIYAGAFIGAHAKIGPGSIIYPNAVVREHCRLGARCVVHAGATIGSDGFGFAPLDGQWIKIPQVGTVEIGDDVEIGANTAIDRATCGVTRIGTGTKIDNLVQVGHNVQIGVHCVIAGMVGIAGSAVIGNNVRVGAYTGIAGHIEIGDGASVGARSGVASSIPPGSTVSGFPAKDHQVERRVLVSQGKIPDLIKRVRQLERQLAQKDE